MPRRPAARSPRPKSRKKTKRRLRLSRFWPSAALRRRWFRIYRRAPPAIQGVVGVAALCILWLALNGLYQVVRKPSELFFPVSGALYKTPVETWQQYQSIFRRHATHVITPELLAAFAQVEGSGNPVVRTYWRWSFKRDPFEVYRPASSAVGMYQITDGTFAQARRYCIHDHVVVEDGPWSDFRSCWLNSLYTRVIPSDAAELTSAYLDRSIANALQRHPAVAATLQQKQDLAAVMHLCGAGAGEAYVRRNFRLSEDQRCGDHEVRVYVARINAMKQLFGRLGSSAQ
jgi:hypothetical protein